MIENKQSEIIKKIYDTDEVKRILFLKSNLNNNKKYRNLLLESNKKNSNIIDIRKQLFEINEFKEYMSLQMNLKLSFKKINNIIISLVEKGSCNKL